VSRLLLVLLLVLVLVLVLLLSPAAAVVARCSNLELAISLPRP
jgi:hypothetical protein